MAGWLIALALVLGAALAVALSTPIDFDIAARRDPGLRVRVRLSWLFGLVATEIAPGGRERPTNGGESGPGSKRKGGAGSFKKVTKIVRSRGFLAGVARLVRRILTGIEIRRAELWAHAGFEDPADTGRFLSILYPVSRWLGSTSRYSVHLEPDFQQAVLWFDARTMIRIVPARVIGPALAFALSPATWRAAFAAVRS